MDFCDVVDFTLKSLRAGNLVGEKVMRDLRLKSTEMGSCDWMKYLRSSVSTATYNDIRDRYKENRKSDVGFTPMDAGEALNMARIYDNVFAL